MLASWSLETPHKRAKPHPGSIAVFLYPKSGCYGREARPIQYLFTGKSRGSLVAVSNLPATFCFMEGSLQLRNCPQGYTMKNRTLKVRETHRDYNLKDQNHKGNPTTGFILLKGTWLEKAGFTIDTPVSVTMHKNCLLLVPEEN